MRCGLRSTSARVGQVDGEDLREASRAQWSGVAGGWAEGVERREGGPAGVAADWMLEAVRLEPGERVLELACGAGDVGLRAAEAVGPSGRVVCSDFAEPMVHVVRRRAEAAGLAQLEARVLDAEALDLAGESFDAVLCRMGYMLMSDPAAALRGSAAVLDRGGRLALAVWGPKAENPWLSAVTDAVMSKLGAPPPAPGTPGPFALSDHDRLRDLMVGAGLANVVIEELPAKRRHHSLDDWWAETRRVSGPIGLLLSQLAVEQVAAIREDAFTRAERYVAGDGVRFPASIVAAVARRP